jgi:tetratricopeptide (TPR) repeat protein
MEQMPTRRETEAQLARILASRTFEEASKLMPLLRHLVYCELDGKPVDEYMLGIEVFAKPTDWIPMHEATVRQSFVNLRKRLTEYYDSEGNDDLVLIDFPKRNGYRPRYLYNPRSDARERLQRAGYRLQQTFPDLVECGDIADELKDCIALHPSSAPAYAMLAEVSLLGALCDETYRFAARDAVLLAEAAIEKCLELNDQLWAAHVTAGALHCCRFAWSKADRAFATALALAPSETRAHFWYAAFLLAVGRIEEAKNCVTWRMKKAPQDRFTKIIRPLFLYVMREYKQAYDELTMQSLSYPAILTDSRYTSGDAILECDNWLTEGLLACLCLALNYTRPAWRYAEAAVKNSKVGAHNGLVVLARAEIGKRHPGVQEQADSLLDDLEGDAQWTGPLSFALAYMGLGKTEEAIAKLAEAMDDGHPLMVWLHLWPVFDPLRERESFKHLLGRMYLAGSDCRD